MLLFSFFVHSHAIYHVLYTHDLNNKRFRIFHLTSVRHAQTMFWAHIILPQFIQCLFLLYASVLSTDTLWTAVWLRFENSIFCLLFRSLWGTSQYSSNDRSNVVTSDGLRVVEVVAAHRREYSNDFESTIKQCKNISKKNNGGFKWEANVGFTRIFHIFFREGRAATVAQSITSTQRQSPGRNHRRRK